MLEKELQKAMPELFSPQESVYPHTDIDLVRYVVNREGRGSVTYLFEHKNGFSLNMEPRKVYNKSLMDAWIHQDQLLELETPIFVKRGEPIHQHKRGTYFVVRNAERTYVSRRSELPQRRTWYDIRRAS